MYNHIVNSFSFKILLATTELRPHDVVTWMLEDLQPLIPGKANRHVLR